MDYETNEDTDLTADLDADTESQIAKELGVKVFMVPQENDPQLVVARKKDGNNHFVVTTGMKAENPAKKLRYFRLEMKNPAETEFDVYEYEEDADIAWMQNFMLQDKNKNGPEAGL